MFWTRARREARRQKVLDELLELDPGDRLERLDLAVAAHELRPDEVGPALHMVERLDRLRQIRVQFRGRMPGWENLPQPLLMPGSQAKSRPLVGRRPRPALPAVRESRPAASDLASIEPTVADASAEESWPSIAWLRP